MASSKTHHQRELWSQVGPWELEKLHQTKELEAAAELRRVFFTDGRNLVSKLFLEVEDSTLAFAAA